MELYHASQQWATRPDDERFNSLDEMFAATKEYADVATERTVPWSDMRVDAGDGDLTLVGKAGVPAKLTHYAFGQLAARVGAPPAYLRALPATLAAQNLNHGLKARSGDGDAKLLFHVNDSVVLRAVTGEVYERVWNYEVISRLQELAAQVNLVPGQQTFNWSDGGPDGSAPSAPLDPHADKALYASDHDMFAFMMTPDRVILDPMGQPMRRGVIAHNSEVGNGSLWLMTFLFKNVCGNHIIWGANGVIEIRMPHVGKIRRKFWDARAEIKRYMDSAASIEEAAFERMTVQIADDKDAVLDKLFGIRSLGLSRKALSASYDAVVPDEDGDPKTVWGIANGVTRYSQETPYADERVALDRAAGKLLAFEF